MDENWMETWTLEVCLDTAGGRTMCEQMKNFISYVIKMNE